MLNALSNKPVECMVKIERLHFNIYFNKPKSSFFSKYFGKKGTIEDYETDKAKQYYID